MSFDKSYMSVSSAYKLAAIQGTLVKPKKPIYNQFEKALEAFLLIRSRINRLNLLGKVLEQDKLAEIIRITVDVTECPGPIARTLLQPFYKCFMSKQALDIICWQIAGNRNRLKDIQPMLYTGKLNELGWMAGVIAEHLTDSNNITGCYRVRIVDGPAAGLDMYMATPRKLRLMSDVTGVTRKLGKERLPLIDFREAVQLRLLVYPEQVSILNFYPGPESISVSVLTNVNSIGLIRTTPKQKKYNKDLTTTRKQLCTYKYPIPCHVCKIGYDQCERACQPRKTTTLIDTDTILIKGKNICQKILEEE
jgi:hypothetical protein